MRSSISIGDVVQHFMIDGELLHAEENATGLINTTFIASFLGTDGSPRRYVFQRINDHVFPDPIAVMRNVKLVTDHINSELSVAKDQRTLRLVPTKSGSYYNVADDGGVWRAYHFIEGCRTYDVVENIHQAYQAAYAFGQFQNKVSTISPEKVVETIPNFHNTPKRYARLLEVAAADSLGRLTEVARELDFIKSRAGELSKLIDLRDAGDIPVRVTHNDTKFNNVMLAEVNDEAVCVIDLDTVMPGLSLYDFGDLVRTAVNPALEGSDELSAVAVRMPIFQALVDGYLTACTCLNQAEIDHLACAGKLITLELAIRFLTDYLEGDIYFKTEHLYHNLQRTRIQLKLVEKLEEQESDMVEYVKGWERKTPLLR
ncbi:MAG: phosphotransferase enzyme family protein [Akkermansiaceae bacterium]